MLTLRYDRGTLLLEDPGDLLPEGFLWDDRVQKLRGPALLYHDLVMALHRQKIPFQDLARTYEVLPELRHHTDRQPRDYQLQSLAAWKAAGRRGVIELPTGTGKSMVAELCIADAKRSALVIAPTIDLVNQWSMVLERAFQQKIGMIGAGQHEVLPLTVSTYDSAYIHMERYGARFGLVVFDEVHHLPSPGYRQSAEMSLAPFRLGLSATPERPDNLHLDLDRLVGRPIYTKSIRQMSGEYLAEYGVHRVEVDLADAEKEAYEQSRKIYKEFLQKNKLFMGAPDSWKRFLIQASRSRDGRAALRAHREYRQILHGAQAKIDALEEILGRHRDSQVVLFTNDNATVYRISREFLIPCITHQTEGKERKVILERFTRGEYKVVATSRVLNEGVDLPAAEVGIVISGTGTVREHVQRLGRILRPREGKRAVLYEIVIRDSAEEFTSERRRAHDAYQ